MERYINADEAIHELAKVFMPNDYPKIVRAISSTRTADVRLDIHARWVKGILGFPYCSNCLRALHKDAHSMNFCSFCGADMRKRGERREDV